MGVGWGRRPAAGDGSRSADAPRSAFEVRCDGGTAVRRSQPAWSLLATTTLAHTAASNPRLALAVQQHGGRPESDPFESRAQIGPRSGTVHAFRSANSCDVTAEHRFHRTENGDLQMTIDSSSLVRRNPLIVRQASSAAPDDLSTEGLATCANCGARLVSEYGATPWCERCELGLDVYEARPDASWLERRIGAIAFRIAFGRPRHCFARLSVGRSAVRAGPWRGPW